VIEKETLLIKKEPNLPINIVCDILYFESIRNGQASEALTISKKRDGEA
jgi:hypothetical protein